MKLITLSSDFAVQSHGCGVMEPVAFGICPDAKVVHLVHDLPDFNIKTSAREMETLQSFPVGFHVCVVDSGVGTKRKGIGHSQQCFLETA
jgi:S-adenosylmethionine hydrolase